MKKEYRVLALNTNLVGSVPAWFEDYGFNTGIAFSDYDVIIIDTNNLIKNYEEDDESPFKNKVLLSEDDSQKLEDDFERLKTQIKDFLKQRKLVFVIVGDNDNCYLNAGMIDTFEHKMFDMNSFLPFKVDFLYLKGEKYEQCNNNLYNDFFNKTGDMILYSAQFSHNNAIPLLRIPNSEKLISAEIPFKNGKIVFLPSIILDPEEEYENDKAVFLNELYKLIRKLYSYDTACELPEWTNDFQILNERQEKTKLQSDLLKIEKLKKKIEKEKEQLKATQHYKTMLTETGTALENTVKQVLSEIGFKLQTAEIGRSDIIAKYKNTYIVAEIKGVTKSAAEKHAAQLEKWVSQFIEENNKQPKALLIVNAFKDIPVFERTEDVFPNQMLQYSVAREHVLISTTQLLCLYIDIKTNPDKKDELITELLSKVGVYTKYSDFDKYLQPITKDEN